MTTTFARTCTECNKGMNEGYCISNGEVYYCSPECLHKNYTTEEWEEMYDDGEGESYYTDWYESEEDPEVDLSAFWSAYNNLTNGERKMLNEVCGMYDSNDNTCMMRPLSPSEKGWVGSLVKKGLIYDSCDEAVGLVSNFFPSEETIIALKLEDNN